MALRIRDYTIITVVQATHHQCDVRYTTSTGIWFLYLSLISVCSALFKSPDQWNKFDLDDILGKGDQLFKSLRKFGVLLIVNNYILRLIRGNDSIYLFDSHSKDENDNVSS